MRSLLCAGTAALLLAAGCGGSDNIKCAANADCIQGGIAGTCLASSSSDDHWCAFTDNDCPGSQQRWGIKSGDGLAGTCVSPIDAGMPDAPIDSGPDAGPDAAHDPDAGPEPVLSTKIFVLLTGGTLTGSAAVFNAETFESLGTLTLPVISAARLNVAEDTLWVIGGNISGGQAGDGHVTAFDPRTLLLKAGYPKTFPGSTCGSIQGFVTPEGLYCPSSGATTETDDVVHLMGPPDFVVTHSSPNTPSIFKVGGGDGIVLASYGGSADKTVGVFDRQLDAVTGSPVTAPTTGSISLFAASQALNRFAVASYTQVVLYDATTLTQVGATATYPGTNVAGLAFDADRAQLIISTTGGAITTRAASDFSEKVALTVRGAVGTHRPVLDATRGRVYLVESTVPVSHLIVLDAATLVPVAGSPVTLPDSGEDVASY
jgi:hypothetical protein